MLAKASMDGYIACKTDCKKHPQYAQGFTLLEMLVVIGLLALIAGLGMQAYDTSADDDAIANQIAQSEMTELAKALRQFKRDVGRYPNVSHPTDFTLLVQSSTDSNNDGIDDNSGLPTFDKDTGRGIRAPYLEKRGLACMDVKVPIGTYNLPPNKIAYAKLDPFKQANPSSQYAWYKTTGSTTCAERLEDRQGAPYLLIDFPSGSHPQIVSTGSDGVYGGVNGADACLPATGSDDLVLCL